MKDGQIKTEDGRCVTMRLPDTTLIAEDCKAKDNGTQAFTYQKDNRFVSIYLFSRCVIM